MKTTYAVITVTAIILVAIVACYIAAPNYVTSTEPSTGAESGSSANSAGTSYVLIQGSGATFPLLQIEYWIAKFQSMNPNIKISYVGKGSGAGQKDFFNHLVDFAGSDPPLSRDVWLKYKGKVLQIPYLVGAVAIVYNIPDIPSEYHLKLTGDVIVRIYMGNITYWDDLEIKKLNPELAGKLPHKEIIVIHRSDASGTTQIFTTFLAKRSMEWREKVGIGKVVEWPVDKLGRGIGAKGNPGVAQVIKTTPYSIGYLEWAYALRENLSIAAIDNREGEFVLPSMKGIQSAIKNALPKLPDDPLGDWSGDLDAIIDAPGGSTYPIVAWTHLLVWKTYSDQAKVNALRTWIRWVLTEGRNYILPGYAPMPEELAATIAKAVDEIGVGK